MQQSEENLFICFFTCEYAWSLWCHWLEEWKVSWVVSNDQKCFFESWMEVPLRVRGRENGGKLFLCLFGQYADAGTCSFFTRRKSIKKKL